MHTVIAWILAFMFAHAPISENVSDPYTHETYDEAAERYQSIAMDIATVAFDPNERPLFPGDNGRLETAALLASIAFWEGGGYRKDIDTGVGPHARGDHGNSVCLMQMNVGRRRTMEGWTAENLLADRQKCIRAGLHMAEFSFRACYGLSVDQKLRVYASGSCHKGSRESTDRVMTGLSWFYTHKPRFYDEEVLQELAYEKRVIVREESIDETPKDEMAKN